MPCQKRCRAARRSAVKLGAPQTRRWQGPVEKIECIPAPSPHTFQVCHREHPPGGNLGANPKGSRPVHGDQSTPVVRSGRVGVGLATTHQPHGQPQSGVGTLPAACSAQIAGARSVELCPRKNRATDGSVGRPNHRPLLDRPMWAHRLLRTTIEARLIVAPCAICPEAEVIVIRWLTIVAGVAAFAAN